MTDNENIKALEGLASGCFDCNDGCKQSSECPVNIISCALDLINRLQVKNKELDEKLIIQKGLIDTQQAEIERLQKVRANILKVMKENISQTESEAIKEFAERLKEQKQWGVDINDYVFVYVIEDLVKEMTEGCE